jgi:hypothetical protein
VAAGAGRRNQIPSQREKYALRWDAAAPGTAEAEVQIRWTSGCVSAPFHGNRKSLSVSVSFAVLTFDGLTFLGLNATPPWPLGRYITTGVSAGTYGLIAEVFNACGWRVGVAPCWWRRELGSGLRRRVGEIQRLRAPYHIDNRCIDEKYQVSELPLDGAWKWDSRRLWHSVLSVEDKRVSAA